MIDLVVHHNELAYIRPLIMVLILMDVLKVCFTTRLNSTAVENHLVRKTMVDLVVHHIEFAHIRPLIMVLILMDVFKVCLTARLNSTAVENHLVKTNRLERQWPIKRYTISSLPIFNH